MTSDHRSCIRDQILIIGKCQKEYFNLNHQTIPGKKISIKDKKKLKKTLNLVLGILRIFILKKLKKSKTEFNLVAGN